MAVWAIANQKGGVGKTTTVVNLAAYLALAGKRTLVVDCDPQGNASSVLAADYTGSGPFADQAPVPCQDPNLAILPAGRDLLAQEAALHQDLDGRHALRRIVVKHREHYEWILIDCPPNLTLLPANALAAADRVLVPIQCEYYAMEGLGQIMAFLADQREQGGAEPLLGGILLTMYEERQAFARQVAAEICMHFPEQVLRTRIPRDLALAVAPSHGRHILAFDPLCPGALAYLAATKELLDEPV